MALLSGCGGNGLNPVEGQVVWSDTGAPAKELEGALVNFELPEKNTSAIANIQADGSFQLMTAKPNDGALAGEYTVVISEHLHAGVPSAAHPRYNDRSTSDLKATVEPGRNKLVLKVDRAKK